MLNIICSGAKYRPHYAKHSRTFFFSGGGDDNLFHVSFIYFYLYFI